MYFYTLSRITGIEIIPGYTAKFIHTEQMTFAYWDVADGAPLPEHQHPHQQVAHVLAGRYELTIDGETQILEPGQVAVIPGDVPHSGRALTACQLLDVFYPVREEYRSVSADV
ncbi:MAG: cupin domain-containing protein [Gemmatimonadetes bacterium]|nr:MAG: cupin domain-containing protein [Gemmatimonadota bacterium]